MTRRRGYTLVEMITVAGLSLVVCSLVGSLYLTTTRAIETELARSEMMAGAREVCHYLKRDVRGAESLAVSGDRLTLIARGEAITYANSKGGVSRGSATGTRLLGGLGLRVRFSPLGAKGVEVKVTGQRTVRSRAIRMDREMTLARRNP